MKPTRCTLLLKYIYFNFSTCFGQLCVHHQQNLLYLCDNGIFYSVWLVVWSHPNQQTRPPPIKVNVKWSSCRPDVAQKVGSGIALLFLDRGTRRGWVVSSTPRPQFTSGKDPVPILQEAGWAPGPVWTGGNSRLHRDSIPDRPAHSQSLYRLSYRAHINKNMWR